FEATSGLKMENDNIHFSARFGGVSRDILIPVENVIAIYARENGQGMAFEASAAVGEDNAQDIPDSESTAPILSSVPVSEPEKKPAESATKDDDDPEPPKKGGRPVLTRIK
ncbi:ClpXP protease specificity-enhancing factor SspB, partial [Klebsiella pneumoniae]|uniref:ClpXP protease specificity-enhancing factor SspB n=2 Tax=Pseudomonadota TaxID=1224 RepID=UPI001BD858CD